MLSTLLLLLAGVALTAVAVITFAAIVEWFQDRESLVLSDTANLAFTIKDRLDNGDYAIYQGVFNSNSTTLLDCRKLASSSVDASTEAVHKSQPLVIYQ